jgi:hypothetical protein
LCRHEVGHDEGGAIHLECASLDPCIETDFDHVERHHDQRGERLEPVFAVGAELQDSSAIQFAKNQRKNGARLPRNDAPSRRILCEEAHVALILEPHLFEASLDPGKRKMR